MGLKDALSDRAFMGSAARQGLRHVVAAAARILTPFGPRAPHKLLIAPQDLRTADPTIATEIYAGQLKFAGKLLETHGRSPFELELPSEAFAAELHGFGWIRHLKAADSALSRVNARAHVTDWIKAHRGRFGGIAAQPDVVARRMISWLSQTPMLLEEADAAFYQSFIKALTADAARLTRARRRAPQTEIKLMIQVALTHYALCSAESDAALKDAASQLCDLLEAQILSDGGHVSRNPQVPLHLLLDLLPLKLAFLWRRIQTPQPIIAAIDRMMPMLRMMRHADGAIALFNGMGATRADFVAAVLAQDDAMAAPPQNAPYTGYQRMEYKGSIVIIDAAKAPKPPLAGKSHAAPAAFEFSADGCRIVVNCGSPPAHRPEMQIYARLTAAHSTLVVADESIGTFTRTNLFKALLGPQFTRGARVVGLQRADTPEGSLIMMEHDGYLKKQGLKHERRLALSHDGQSFEGEDSVKVGGHTHDKPYALRFHLHPQVKPTLRDDRRGVFLLLPNRKIWEFEVEEHEIMLEETIFFASSEGLRRSEQIVIKANAAAHPTIAWSFHRTEQ